MKTVFGLIVCVLCLWFIITASHEDKYVMRDGCVYHFTQDWNGISVDGNYTKVTCDSTKFHKYRITK